MITNKTEYLIFILIYLALKIDEGYISSKEIARAEQIPVKYIAQLVSLLSKKGWLDSARGVNGGVKLAVSPEKITVWKIAKLADRDFYFKSCIHGGCALNKKSCELKPFWQEIQGEIKNIMQKKTIADLVQERTELL